MPLLSLEFIGFFFCLFPIYWGFYKYPQAQNAILLASSLGLLWYVDYRFVIAISIFSMVIHLSARLISQTTQSQYRRLVLVIGIVIVIANLCIFKYYDLFRPLVEKLAGHELATIMIPLGISYYTFQSISYLVFVFKTNHKLSFFNLLLYLSFFPTITSGPIIRPDASKNIYGTSIGAVPQIESQQNRSIINPELALSLIIIGIAKKWAVAGILANNLVNPVFDNPSQYGAIAILTAIYGYTLQLFMDFSGYTDMVIGLAMLLGYQLPANFCYPLSAHNIKDFWNRWHITLSTWIRDFIYIPLGGNKKGYLIAQVNVLIAMILSGIWHGYGLNFVIWGALHGIAIVWLNTLDKVTGCKNLLSRFKVGKFISMIITFNFVCFAFVIFHNPTLETSLQIFQALFNAKINTIDNGWSIAILGAMMIYAFSSKQLGALFYKITNYIGKLPTIIWIIYFIILINLVIILAPSGIPNFIYANF